MPWQSISRLRTALYSVHTMYIVIFRWQFIDFQRVILQTFGDRASPGIHWKSLTSKKGNQNAAAAAAAEAVERVVLSSAQLEETVTKRP